MGSWLSYTAAFSSTLSAKSSLLTSVIQPSDYITVNSVWDLLIQLFAALSATFIRRVTSASELLPVFRPPSNNRKANTRAARSVARWSGEIGMSFARMSRVERFHSVKPSVSRSWRFETTRDARLLGNRIICSWSCVCRSSAAGPVGSGESLPRVLAEKAGEWSLLVVPAMNRRGQY